MGDVRRTMDVLVTSSTLLPVFKEKKRKEDVVNTVDGGRRGRTKAGMRQREMIHRQYGSTEYKKK